MVPQSQGTSPAPASAPRRAPCHGCCISRDAMAARDKVGDAASTAAALPGGPASGTGGASPDLALIVALPAVYSASSSQYCLLRAPRGRCSRDCVQPGRGAGGAGGAGCSSLPPGRGCRQGGRAPLAGSEMRRSQPQSCPGLPGPSCAGGALGMQPLVWGPGGTAGVVGLSPSSVGWGLHPGWTPWSQCRAGGGQVAPLSTPHTTPETASSHTI